MARHSSDPAAPGTGGDLSSGASGTDSGPAGRLRHSGDAASARVRREEFANTLTHGLGMLLSAGATAVLVVLAARRGDPWTVTGTAIFGASLLALYTASTLYHAARKPEVKARLRVLDHAGIYLLIAGTYTPFTLGPLRGGWGWSLFGVIWGLAAAGVVFKLFFTGRFDRVSTAVYVAMGWLVLIAWLPLLRALPGASVAWLAAGGFLYTAGTAFYHARRLPYGHAVWHLFVLGGTLCHVLAVGVWV